MNYVEPIRKKEDIELMRDYLLEWDFRNYLLFLVGINTGLRISDIINLKYANVKGWYIVLTERKTKKIKKVKMNNSLKKEMEKYIKQRKMTRNEYIFKSRVGKNRPISRQMAYRILTIAAEECGVENIGTHSMRKTFGYHYYQKYKDIAMLMDLFNHSSPAITKRYIGINQDNQDRALADFKLGF